MVFDPAGPIPERRLLHRRRAVAGAHQCVHRSLQRDSRAIRLDQEEGLPAAVQKPPYHPTLIPGTSSTSHFSRPRLTSSSEWMASEAGRSAKTSMGGSGITMSM